MNLPPEKQEIVGVFGFSHSIVDPKDAQMDENGEVVQHMRIRSKWEIGGVLEIHNSGVRLLVG